jgi:predicted negative regulator of RcsB-dependent stress response
MQPISDIRTFQKRTEFVLSIILILIIIGLVGGYIYIGMRKAQQTDVTSNQADDVVDDRVPTAEEQRSITIQAIEQQNKSATPKDPAEKAAVVTGLEKGGGRVLPAGEKIQTLQALQRQ